MCEAAHRLPAFPERHRLSNPTAGVLARWIWERLRATLPGLAAVIVFETCTTGFQIRVL